MTIQQRITELTGCSHEEAIKTELAARLINASEELRTIEDLTPAEFATLIARAVKLGKAIRTAVRGALGIEEDDQP